MITARNEVSLRSRLEAQSVAGVGRSRTRSASAPPAFSKTFSFSPHHRFVCRSFFHKLFFSFLAVGHCDCVSANETSQLCDESLWLAKIVLGWMRKWHTSIVPLFLFFLSPLPVLCDCLTPIKVTKANLSFREVNVPGHRCRDLTVVQDFCFVFSSRPLSLGNLQPYRIQISAALWRFLLVPTPLCLLVHSTILLIVLLGRMLSST